MLVVLTGSANASTILVVGDSLSAAYGIDVKAGWVNLLQQRLTEQKRSYQVVNASISGDTTAGGLARLPKLLDTHRPDLVIVELGGNDGLRGFMPTQTKKNLTDIVAGAKQRGAKVLLLGVVLPPNYGTQYNERFRRMYHDVATEQKVPLVPFMLEGVAGDAALMQQDGIHPTAGAQPRVLDNVWVGLKPLL